MALAPPVETQSIAFAFLALTGCAVGVSFDFYRALRSVRRLGRVAGNLADGAYGLMVSALVAIGLLGAAWGDLRLYTVLALGAGAAAYFLLASPVVLPAARGGARGTYRLVRGGVRFGSRPLRWCGRTLAHGGHATTRSGRQLFRWLARRGQTPDPPPALPSGEDREGRPPATGRRPPLRPPRRGRRR